ncbi:MAG TPA: bifunctional hydroxymethylpyrimidine kinase/phosphomethylpyrimidine kinase [Blastocatellia bacterium]|nr:bifunctional hydroxymethylpyrimidine kinase/phosphomethylpyrimidine kinase [Blastocatellia bacterium]
MTVAGYDPSGGAGVLADVRTIADMGCYGIAAITSVTFQNTRHVQGASHLHQDAVSGQMRALLDDFEVAAIKTGMLPTASIVEEVALLVAQKKVPILVVDPVIVSSSGYQLIEADALEAMKELLLPLATVVTPNHQEAAALTGMKVGEQHEAELAGSRLRQTGARAVLITGGDASAKDVLLDCAGTVIYSGEFVESTNTHGTGCTFSSALACLLARSVSLRDAVTQAKRYVEIAIRSAPQVGGGRGPLGQVQGFSY